MRPYDIVVTAIVTIHTIIAVQIPLFPVTSLYDYDPLGLSGLSGIAISDVVSIPLDHCDFRYRATTLIISLTLRSWAWAGPLVGVDIPKQMRRQRAPPIPVPSFS